MSSGVYILVDRSLSMEKHWAETIGSLNAYTKELPAVTELFIAVFDSAGYDVVRKGKVFECAPIKPTEFAPRGGTPLLDASARIMHRAFDDNHDKTIVVFLTDGEENNSVKYKKSEVNYMRQKMEDKNWQVMFLGANFDQISDQAASYGSGITKSLNMVSGNFADTMTAFGAASASYTSGLTRSVDFSDDDKLRASAPKSK